MLAICSDLDETPDRGVYREIVSFLSGSGMTAMGPGLDLEVGNSIFFLMPPGQFSYFGTDDAGRQMIRALIRSGHIDCLHSYGDLAKSRADATRVISELEAHGCRLEVWVDHSKAPSNFGPDIMHGEGDLPGSPAYHADLALAHGIRFVWRGRTTGITGQDRPLGLRALTGLLQRRHLVASAVSASKQTVKVLLGGLGHPRWAMYASNAVCRPSRLRDGRPVWEFLRFNPHWAGTGAGATADGLPEVLTEQTLERLMRHEAASVLYTHLGKVNDPRRPLGARAEAAMRRLAALSQAGRIKVTTTQRLLRYLTARDTLRFRAFEIDERVMIELQALEDPMTGSRVPTAQEVMGLTFVMPPAREVHACLSDGQALPVDTVHEAGSTVTSIRWRPLELPVI
jgi:hypothetical protein